MNILDYHVGDICGDCKWGTYAFNIYFLTTFFDLLYQIPVPNKALAIAKDKLVKK